MSTSIALASVASGQAAAAANLAARASCIASVRGYAHDSATVAEMREYAGCVNRLHPEPLGADAVLAWKIAILIVLLSPFVGVACLWPRERGGRPGHTRGEAVVLGTITGLVGSVIVLLLLFVAAVGLRFLFL